MILLLDTSTPICRLEIIEHERRHTYEWEANRELAKGLLGWLEKQLAEEGKTVKDVNGIGVFTGPGSFTGLRIGLTVMNTLADGLQIPIVGCRGAEWAGEAESRLASGENDQIVLPFYGSDANITTPRK